MSGYHCYVLNKEGKISSRHNIEAESDAAAMLKAQTVAEQVGEEFPAVEVWCAARIVVRLIRPPSLEHRRAS